MRRLKIVNYRRFYTFIISLLIIISILLFYALVSLTEVSYCATQMGTKSIDLNTQSIFNSISQIKVLNEQITKELYEMELKTKTKDYVYTTANVRYRTMPNTESEILGVIDEEQEIYRIGICNNGWSYVKINDVKCYMCSDYLSTEKPVTQMTQVTQATITSAKYSPNYLKNMGVVYDGGWRYTWYSEKVLPGGGLNIPGRYSDGNFVRDVNGYLCIASSDFSKGTILNTPWGTAKVYDTGCASGTIDMYVSW